MHCDPVHRASPPLPHIHTYYTHSGGVRGVTDTGHRLSPYFSRSLTNESNQINQKFSKKNTVQLWQTLWRTSHTRNWRTRCRLLGVLCQLLRDRLSGRELSLPASWPFPGLPHIWRLTVKSTQVQPGATLKGCSTSTAPHGGRQGCDWACKAAQLLPSFCRFCRCGPQAYFSFFSFFNIYLFIWLRRVLVAARGIFDLHCSIWVL